jgi:hypothetical protein
MTSGPFISRSDKENVDIQQKKLQISREKEVETGCTNIPGP